MSYGDYSGPDKPNKGKEGGACNRSRCQAEPARWFNHGSYSWYCDDCRRDIETDPVNSLEWQLRWLPEVNHPMFETREMMDARKADEAAVVTARDTGDFSEVEKRMAQYLKGDHVIEDAAFQVSERRRPARQAPVPKDLYGENRLRGFKGRMKGKRK